MENAVIRRLLNNLESYLNDLRTADDITLEIYIKDIRTQRFVERTLQIAIECCVDVAHHIISEKGFREPKSYSDAFVVLLENDILPADSIREYQLMAQFRNRIVHYYEKMDPEQVYAIFKGKLQTFDAFRNQIECWIQSEEDSDSS